MTGRIRTLIAVALLGASLACASSGGKPNAKATNPELLTRSRPELVVRGVIPNAPRATTLVEIEVKVNPDGTADMGTLKVTGVGASDNRNAVTTWVQSLRFRPATQDGVAVVGTYRQSFDVMTRTVRVR